MSYDALTDKQKSFIKRYVLAEVKAHGPMSDAALNHMANEVKAWDGSKALVLEYIENLPKDLGRKTFQSRVKAADKTFRGDGQQTQYDTARIELTQIMQDASLAATSFAGEREKAADEAMVEIRKYHGAGGELPALEARLAEINSAMDGRLPKLEALRTAHDVIVAAKPRLKAKHDKLTEAYGGFEGEYGSLGLLEKDIKAYGGTELASHIPAVQAAVEHARQLMKDGSPRVIVMEALALAQAKNKEPSDILTYTSQLDNKKRSFTTPMSQVATDRPRIAALKPKVQTEYDQALLQISGGDPIGGATKIDELSGKAYCLQRIIATDAAYETESATLDRRITTLKAMAGAALMSADIAKIDAGRLHADKLADDDAAHALDKTANPVEFPAAMAQLESVDTLCQEAEAKAGRAAAFATLAKSAGTGDAATELEEAKRLFELLQAHDAQDLVLAKIQGAQLAIGRAESAIQEGNSAADDLAAAIKEIADGWQQAEILGPLKARHGALDTRLDQVKDSHAQAAYIATQLSNVLKHLLAAKGKFDTGDAHAAADLDAAELALDQAVALADAEVDFQTQRAEVAQKITAAQRVARPGADLHGPDMPKHLRAAENAAALNDHTTALAELAKSRAMADAALLAERIRAKDVPGEDELKAIAAQDGGRETMDAIIASLNPKDVRQDMMVALMAARFDMDVSVFKGLDKDKKAKNKRTERDLSKKKAPNLLMFYNVMAKVPEKDTRLNDSLKQLQQIETSAASDYHGGTARIRMICYGVAKSSGTELNNRKELLEIDDDAQAVPENEAPTPNYGTWTMLHEIGHAVDDQKGFMSKNGKNAAFGGWEDYGKGNLKPVADAASKAFDFDHVYVETTIVNGKSGAIPDVPQRLIDSMGEDQAKLEWTSRKSKFDAWHKATREKSEMWESGSASQQHALNIDGTVRVLHEAYDKHWVSYDLSARKKGITGYQFRAPGEWFSELYAAFYSKKLKNNHPAMSWLKAL
ncbi:MAG: hypothetical protein AAGF79_06425 [Pseudomonadota bacterium]